MSVTGTLGFDAGDGPGPSLTSWTSPRRLFGMSGAPRGSPTRPRRRRRGRGRGRGGLRRRRPRQRRRHDQLGRAHRGVLDRIGGARRPAPTRHSTRSPSRRATSAPKFSRNWPGSTRPRSPVGSIANTRESPRLAFARVEDDPDTADGSYVDRHPRCRHCVRQHGDDLQPHQLQDPQLPITSPPPALQPRQPTVPCSRAINQKSIDLAFAQMTPAEQAAAVIPTLGSDVVRQTGRSGRPHWLPARSSTARPFGLTACSFNGPIRRTPSSPTPSVACTTAPRGPRPTPTGTSPHRPTSSSLTRAAPRAGSGQFHSPTDTWSVPCVHT